MAKINTTLAGYILRKPDVGSRKSEVGSLKPEIQVAMSGEDINFGIF